MNKIILFLMFVFQAFFSSHAKDQNILVTTISYIGNETLKFTEYSETNIHTIVIYDTISDPQKRELRNQFETIFSPHQVNITTQPGATVISLVFDQNDYEIKSDLKDTMRDGKKLTISVYRTSAIRILDQMTKKPILEYAKNKKMLSEIA